MNAIEIKNLKKYYWLFKKDYKIIPWLFTKKGYVSIKKALEDVTLTVGHGEVVGIIGKNGAGKSTLMKIVAGITFPTEGQVSVNGKVGSLINLSAGFFPDYTGRQNIYYKGKIMGMKEKQIDSIINDIIEFADIGQYFDLPLKTYSSGMAARLGFSLAVFSDPDILIVDEVFAVGDKDFQKKSFEKTSEMFKSGKSILFASHNDAQIKKFCNRVIVITEGRIIFDGDVNEGLELYNRG
ncbi:MAG: ABC transporter ATP-binding protein [Clostridia bacterium]|nr:ABC transporter ATP-binding protein [Clostridia bacterium]MBN2883541.1 ABC transporter ATP-binding protein [Clostridia bacterium]